MGRPALELAGCWVELGLCVETEISGRALTDWYYVGPGGLWWSNVLNSALPPQRLRPDTQLEHQDLSATRMCYRVFLLLGTQPGFQAVGSESKNCLYLGTCQTRHRRGFNIFLELDLLSCTSPIATKNLSLSSCCSFRCLIFKWEVNLSFLTEPIYLVRSAKCW